MPGPDAPGKKEEVTFGAPCEDIADHADKLTETTEFDDFIDLRDSRSDRDKRVELPDTVFNSGKQREETCLIFRFFSSACHEEVRRVWY